MSSTSTPFREGEDGYSPGDGAHAEHVIAIVRHNIDSIKAEIASGIHIDPKIIRDLEAQLKHLEKMVANGTARRRP
jgi:hypothetical protein